MALGRRHATALRCACLAALTALVGFAPTTAHAAVFRHSEGLILAAADTLHDDLYAAGKNIIIEGVVDGDLVVAGRSIVIKGAVTGDVLGAASELTLSGPVGGSVRVAAREVMVTGAIAHDVVAAGNQVQLLQGSQTGRDALLAGATVSVSGAVQRNVLAAAERMEITDTGRIGGDLTYTSQRSYVRAAGAQIDGKVFWRAPSGKDHQPTAGERLAKKAIHWMRWVIGLLLLGLFVVLPFPRFAQRTYQALTTQLLLAIGVGFAVLTLLPLAGGTLLIAGFAVGGWWIGAGLLMAWVFLLLLGRVVAAVGVGRTLGANMGRPAMSGVLALVIGVVLLGVLGEIPFVGGMICSIAVLAGLGALSIAVIDSIRRQHAPTGATST